MLSYADISKQNKTIPHKLNLGKLFVYGSNHTNNFTDAQVRDIDSIICAFKPTLIMYEGDGIGMESNKRMSLETFYEMGYALYLADSLGIKSLNIEPEPKKKYAQLLNKYQIDDVLIATLALQITMMQAAGEALEPKYRLMASDLRKEGLPLTDEQLTFKYFKEIYQSKLNKPYTDESFDSREFQSKYAITIFNTINQEANKIRDQHMLDLVNREIVKGERVFLIVGGWHAIVCEPALRTISQASQAESVQPYNR